MPSADKTKCECPKGYIVDQKTIDQFAPTCIECPAPSVPSQNKTVCMKCVAPASYDSNFRDCVCNSESRLVETVRTLTSTDPNTGATTTSQEGVKQCEACTRGAFQGPTSRPQYSCSVCPNEGEFYVNVVNSAGVYPCQCSSEFWASANGKCLLKTDITLALTSQYQVEIARTVNYDFVEINDGGSIGQVSVQSSDTFNYLYNDAAVGCKEYGNP